MREKANGELEPATDHPTGRALTLRRKTDVVPLIPPVRAAQYVRMSTEQQAYSPQNQIAAIHEYADKRGIVIVRTYIDEARSGLRIQNRPGLQQLLRAIQMGSADFDMVLVYDVSRWGRFQDPDESAYYEFICRRHGKRVEYCAEPFENDGGTLGTIMKNIKRTMAGEYSRELSVKTFEGQWRAGSKGFRTGATAGYGLRRMLVAPDGSRKGTLEYGEHKALSNYRIILVPGPKAEVATVRRIYSLYVRHRMTPDAIVTVLNQEKIRTHSGQPWARGSVCSILTNEKYIGNLVYNRGSSKLGAKRTLNDPSEWLRMEGAFRPIVPAPLFYAAQARMKRRAMRRYTEDEMLDRLREALARTGTLSGRRLGRKYGTPSPSCYWHRFGTMANAYRRIGYDPRVDTSYVLHRPHLRKVRAAVTTSVANEVQKRGGSADFDPDLGWLRFGLELSTVVLIAPCLLGHSPSRKSPRWAVSSAVRPDVDLVIVVRMDLVNNNPRDYFLLPRKSLAGLGGVLNENNGSTIEIFRTDTLEPLYRALAHEPLGEVFT